MSPYCLYYWPVPCGLFLVFKGRACRAEILDISSTERVVHRPWECCSAEAVVFVERVALVVVSIVQRDPSNRLDLSHLKRSHVAVEDQG